MADGHLGTLARYLRLLGFDTLWDTRWSDEALAAISATERRILLTRDRGLLKTPVKLRDEDQTPRSPDRLR